MRPGIGEILIPFALFCYVLFQWLPAILATTIIVGVIGAAVYYQHYEKQHWKRLGVPGPPAHFLFGNTLEMTKGFHRMDAEWQEKYGRIVGNHFIGRPDLLINDLDLVKEVMVKEFPHFMDRVSIMPVDKNNDFSLFENALTVKEGEEWKLIRNQITPAFTTGKIKKMVPTFNESSKTFCDVIAELSESGEAIALKDRTSRFTLDVISKTSFGLDANLQRNLDDPMLKHAQTIFNLRGFEPAFALLAFFPNLCRVYQRVTKNHLFRNDTHTFFKNLLTDLLERRKADKESFGNVDFFQLLLNSMEEETADETTAEDKDIVHEEVKKTKNKRGLKPIEVLSQAFIFLLAGYETTATILQLTLYMLANYPEIQTKIRDEVNSIVDPQSDDITYEDIAKMHYVEQVVCETMRLYPPTARTNRICTEDTYLRDMKVEKGCSVSIPIWLIHHDEDNYPNHMEFDPDRFSPEEKARRDPLAFLPFGYGPRNCIGMRFAQFELRMILAHVVRKFEISLPEGAPQHPLEVDTQALVKPVEVLKAIFKKIDR